MGQHDCLFTPGTLWNTLLERTAHAQQCGAIHSISTTSEEIQEGEITFQVRVIKTLAMKTLATASQKDVNPFLPYNPDLYVAEVSRTHIALLNRFNVVQHHMLIVTRGFESQEAFLTQEDCEGLLFCLAEIDGVAFYNAGTLAGASQPHKHLQLIPFSGLTNNKVPIAPLLQSVKMTGNTGIVAGFPFLHAYAPMDSAWFNPGMESAKALLARYHSLLRSVGWSVEDKPEGSASSPPYNLLVTRKWLLLVPRSQEFFEGISINALGFAGAFLVKDITQLKLLKEHGPLTALQRVALPREL